MAIWRELQKDKRLPFTAALTRDTLALAKGLQGV